MMTRHSISIGFLVAWIAGAPTVAVLVSSEPTRTLQLVRGIENSWILPVVVNGKRGGLFVDCGAIETVMDKADAKSMKVKLQPTQITMRMVGAAENFGSGEVTIEVTGCSQEDFPGLSGERLFAGASISELPASKAGPNLGLIGLQELKAAGAVIDVAGGRILLHPKGDYKAPADMRAIQMWICPRSGAWGIPVTVNNKSCVLTADTGAPDTIIDVAYAKYLGLRQRRLESGEIADCPISLKLGKQVDLGKVNLRSGSLQAIRQPTVKKRPIIGVLGLEQLIRTKSMIDCRKGILYVSPPPIKKSDTPEQTTRVDGSINRVGSI